MLYLKFTSIHPVQTTDPDQSLYDSFEYIYSPQCLKQYLILPSGTLQNFQLTVNEGI